MRQRSLVMSTRSRNEVFAGRVDSKYLLGSFPPSAHSITSHSSGRSSARRGWPCETRTRTRAKREDSRSAVPSRHLIVRQACLGRPSASCLTSIGRRSASSPRTRFGGRPLPVRFFGGGGFVPGAHT